MGARRAGAFAAARLALLIANRVVRPLNVDVFLAAHAANIQRASKMLVGREYFCDFRTLLDRYCGFDDVYPIRLPG